jgi:biopolymer transport protein ExbD/biopolymer transport protein TolR
MGMTIGGGGDAKRPGPAMNVTPLVDVTLVVLIIFMVVTPLMTKTFWLNLPPQDDKQKEEPPPDDSQPLVMTIDEAGVIKINQTTLRADELPTHLPRMLAANHQKVLYFDASNEVEYSKAMEALDLARQGGARSIAILTKQVVK